MYRDDVCAVCGESLPPDHLYCREHAAIVDDLLHELGERIPRLLDDLDRVTELLGGIAEETWDYLAEDHDDDPAWPPRPMLELHADGGDVDVDVDAEPGMVTVQVTHDLRTLLSAVQTAMRATDVRRMATAAGEAEGAGATH